MIHFLEFAFANQGACLVSLFILASLLVFAYFVWRELMWALVGWRDAGKQPINCPMLDEEFYDDDDEEFECDECREQRENDEQAFNN